ncbi:MAG: hypothetical protein DHS20C14_15610 [Phycisphaeraceae bacterium]|nr:MAG: hypothetical protein DHS20C14_15610 [Phycisphaeraceae bacterium]
MPRSLAHLALAFLLALQSVVGGFHGVGIVCLGGDHHQEAPAERATACEHACPHSPAATQREAPRTAHTPCGCIDIEIGFPEPIATVTPGFELLAAHASLPSDAWPIADRSPPTSTHADAIPPPWHDPGGQHRLAIVASTRLTI